MEIQTAKLIENGVLINGSTSLPDGNSGHMRDSYSAWLAEGNTPEPMDMPSLDDLKSVKRKELRINCSDAIYTPFQSSALGSHHLYDSRDVDQMNLARIVAIGSGGNIFAHDNVEFVKTAHTAYQCLTLITDMDTHIESERTKLEGKIASVNAAVDSDAIDAVIW